MNRVETGIPKLDEMLNGGFMRGDAVMVAGGAGTGKSTLALQYIVNGITRFGEKGIYVTFEQLPDQFYRDAMSFGWDLRKMEAEDKFRLICTSPDLLLESSEEEHLLDESIGEVQPRRIVIDSLSHLEMFIEKSNLRKEAYRLIMYLKKKGLSSILVWESPQMSDGLFTATDAGLSFLVDSILLLKYVEIESSIRKALIVLKMRGSEHDKRLQEFQITNEGFKVIAPFSGYEGIITGTPRKAVTEKMGKAWSEAFKKKV